MICLSFRYTSQKLNMRKAYYETEQKKTGI